MSRLRKKGQSKKNKTASRSKHMHRPASAGSETEPLALDVRADDMALPSRINMERTFSGLHDLLSGQNITSSDQANDLLDDLVGKSIDDLADPENSDPQHLAQQLAYDAMDAPSNKQASRLAHEALELDPGCVDALTIVADLTRSPKKRLVLYEEAVKTGEERLGVDYFSENKGRFWGILETRPYMRAKRGLVDALVDCRRHVEAMRHLEELLELCPGDNMGVRFDLLSTYLMADQPEQALDLLNRYADEGGPTWYWGAVLIHYLLRDFDAAGRSLEEARKRNPYVEPYLTGTKKIPDEQPEFYRFGEDSEAIICANHLVAPWSLQPVALAWLLFGGRPGDGRYCGVLT